MLGSNRAPISESDSDRAPISEGESNRGPISERESNRASISEHETISESENNLPSIWERDSKVKPCFTVDDKVHILEDGNFFYEVEGLPTEDPDDDLYPTAKKPSRVIFSNSPIKVSQSKIVVRVFYIVDQEIFSCRKFSLFSLKFNLHTF
jgi:hypothetical protein